MRIATWVRVAGVSALVVLTAACDPEPSSPTGDDLAAVDVSPDHTLTVDEDGFEPAELEVEAGEVIEIRNEGDDVHTATSTDRFTTGFLQPGDTTILVLVEPGVVDYRDLTDPANEGTITVVPAPTGP